MKTRGITFKLFTTAAFFLFLFIWNMGSLRCESPPGGLSINQPQAKWTENRLAKSTAEQDVQDEKGERFKELEWIIKQQLIHQYQRLEVNASLEDNLD